MFAFLANLHHKMSSCCSYKQLRVDTANTNVVYRQQLHPEAKQVKFKVIWFYYFIRNNTDVTVLLYEVATNIVTNKNKMIKGSQVSIK